MLRIFDYRGFCFGAALPHSAAVAVSPTTENVFFFVSCSEPIRGEQCAISSLYM